MTIESDRLAVLRAVPVHLRDGRPHHVRLLDIPPPWRDEFRALLLGSCCPLIEGEGECAWVSDWLAYLNQDGPRWMRPTAAALDQLRGTVRRFDDPTAPVWPADSA